jgi:predicted SAM-dependent methyltransferase
MIKLHIGCGPHILTGWINIDLEHNDADIQCDVRGGLPFENETISFIFSEHMIEHLTISEAEQFLMECIRVLKPTGIMRISTPNLDHVIDAYISGDIGHWGGLWQPENRCKLINEAFYSWGHKFLYNKEEIIRILQQIGFSSLNFESYRRSAYQDLAGLETRPFHNEIIVEASK